MAEIIVGFDSAWTDNPKAPGAICALKGTGPSAEFVEPRLARFDGALAFIDTLAGPGDFVLVALDQPTIVPNLEGCRPVERVAGSLVNGLKGGVQPARRGGGGASMFGDHAPVWRFLHRLGAMEQPFAGRTASSGRHLIEVFPALALPSLVPAIFERGRAAKYNPGAPRYLPEDWILVTGGLAQIARRFRLNAVENWLQATCFLLNPSKADQDRLDSVICLLIAFVWRFGPPDDSMVLGDLATGYMVTPATATARALLTRSAILRGVPIDDPGSAIEAERTISAPQHAIATPVQKDVAPRARRASGRSAIGALAAAELRVVLEAAAKSGQLLTYGEVAQVFGQSWSRGFGSALKRALNELGRQNADRGEPLLMSLVVNRVTRLPGGGFFDEIGAGEQLPHEQRLAHERYTALCFAHPW